ncbi:MAG: NAD(P)-dependent oxidoreductase [Acidobacteriota bacterium]|nr:MAG: NAD(P)-dependent oxidoreductase [Acidobacteriota bacterium]
MKKLDIAIAGATGVLGRHVVPRLVERGHRVRALARNDSAEGKLSRQGVDCHRGDILVSETLDALVAGVDVALHLATAIPSRDDPAPEWEPNDRIRREGTKNLIDACKRAGVRDYVQQSILLLQAGRGAEWITEDTPITPHAITQSAADMEALVEHSRLRWLTLRGGLFYGAGTGLDDNFRKLAREGALIKPGDGSDFLSLIHVSDMASAVVVAVESDVRHSVLSVADDRPVMYGELFDHIAALEGMERPRKGGPAILPSFRASNARIRDELGWRPHYASFRSGLA